MRARRDSPGPRVQRLARRRKLPPPAPPSTRISPRPDLTVGSTGAGVCDVKRAPSRLSGGWAPSKNPGEKNRDFSQSPLRTAKVAKKKPYFMSSLRSWRCFAPLRETLRLPYPVMNARCVFHHCWWAQGPSRQVGTCPTSSATIEKSAPASSSFRHHHRLSDPRLRRRGPPLGCES